MECKEDSLKYKKTTLNFVTIYVTNYVTMVGKCNNLNFNVTKFVTPLKAIKSVVWIDNVTM